MPIVLDICYHFISRWAMRESLQCHGLLQTGHPPRRELQFLWKLPIPCAFQDGNFFHFHVSIDHPQTERVSGEYSGACKLGLENEDLLLTDLMKLPVQEGGLLSSCEVILKYPELINQITIVTKYNTKV